MSHVRMDIEKDHDDGTGHSNTGGTDAEGQGIHKFDIDTNGRGCLPVARGCADGPPCFGSS